MSKTTITTDEWQQALQEVVNDQEETVPKGWITMQEFAHRVGKSTTHASKFMRQLVLFGKAEVKKFTILSGNRVWSVPHYRLKK